MSDHIKPMKIRILASETSPVMFKFIAILSAGLSYILYILYYTVMCPPLTRQVNPDSSVIKDSIGIFIQAVKRFR